MHNKDFVIKNVWKLFLEDSDTQKSLFQKNNWSNYNGNNIHITEQRATEILHECTNVVHECTNVVPRFWSWKYAHFVVEGD